MRACPNVGPTRDPADIPEQKDSHVQEMSRLMVEWRERGLFKPRPIVSSLYGLCVVATICTAVRCSPVAPVLAGLACGTAWAHCGFLQHMGAGGGVGALPMLQAQSARSDFNEEPAAGATGRAGAAASSPRREGDHDYGRVGMRDAGHRELGVRFSFLWQHFSRALGVASPRGSV